MSRETFLARVRQAVQSGRRYRVHTHEAIDSDVGYVGAGPDPIDRLAAEIIAAGGQAYVVSNADDGRHTLKTLLERYRPKTALCWDHPLLQQWELNALLAEQSIGMLHPESLATQPEVDQRAAMLAADIGITSATFAIAETGTLVMASSPQHPRLASLLPPVHIAIIDATQILPDLFDVFDRLQVDGLESMPSNLVLITGPSKTGDIELKLTTGVHGPGEWHVIISQQPIGAQAVSSS
jgi:L-lactate utilization protein LutC